MASIEEFYYNVLRAVDEDKQPQKEQPTSEDLANVIEAFQQERLDAQTPIRSQAHTGEETPEEGDDPDLDYSALDWGQILGIKKDNTSE